MWSRISGVRNISRTKEGILKFDGFPHGLNTSVPALRIAKSEASALINYKIRKGGKLVTRSPVKLYSNSATTSNAAVETIAQANIGGTNYTLLVDENHVLYYLDGSLDPTTIGTLEGDAQILSYNGIAVILDGSYIKYLDGVTSVKIAYDAGTGSSGYQFDFTSEDNDDSIQLGDGTNSRVAQKFTSQAWDAGYTIPPITVSAYLTKEGSPTGSITANIRKASDSSVIATATFLSDVSTLDTSTAAKYSATLTASTEMSPSTAYYCSLEHSGGDASNCVHVHYNTVASGGLAYHYTGSWVADTTKNLLMSLTPGMPPKGAYGTIWNKRLWVAGDPSNPGYVWYSNLTHLDWSTTDGGGYIGVVDGDNQNFEVGALRAFYGNLYVFGKQNQPYLTQISGDSPSAYVQSLMFQRPWSTHRTLINAINDLWYGNSEGVAPISGVTEYGDLRTFFASDPVFDRIEDYWSSSTAFAEYYPQDGQYWLVMPTYHRVLVCHTKLAARNPEGSGIRYPWCEYEFYRHDLTSSAYKWTASGTKENAYYLELAAGGDPGFNAQPDFITMDGAVLTEGTPASLADHEWDYTDNDLLGYDTVYICDASGNPDTTGVEIRSILLPTALASIGDDIFIGGSDGYVYCLDSSEYKDLTTIQMLPKLATAYIEIPLGHVNFTQVQLLASAQGGGQMSIKFFTDGQRVTATNTTILEVDDGLTVDDAIMDVDDAYFSTDYEQAILFNYVNFNARSVMLVFTDVTLSGYPLYNNGALLRYRGLSH